MNAFKSAYGGDCRPIFEHVQAVTGLGWLRCSADGVLSEGAEGGGCEHAGRAGQTRFHTRTLRLLERTANTGPDQTWYEPEGVALVVEVVAADTLERDREGKPRKYAAAGDPHFWRVEADGEEGPPVVYVYERDPATKTYMLTGILRDRLKVAVPYEIEIDLTAVNRRPGS
ncbi:Uma2 family endonuclease [Streptomyces sp. B21-083]|uniref:Uma2 family endonuclease n=1 Tax=Streptomyces sp. B21-083 TaxID=3039410 RepID=UPI002FF0A0A8